MVGEWGVEEPLALDWPSLGRKYWFESIRRVQLTRVMHKVRPESHSGGVYFDL